MSNQKGAIVKARLGDDLAAAFYKVCDAEGKTVSSVLREIVERYTLSHEVTRRNLNVEVTIGEPYGRGAHSRDEYSIVAKLTGDVSNLNVQDIYFLLPDFIINGKEPYRVDSAYYHRAFFPDCRNKDGRLLGAKLINNQWEGAIFIYDNFYIENWLDCFGKIEVELSRNILSAVNEKLIDAFSEMLGDGG